MSHEAEPWVPAQLATRSAGSIWTDIEEAMRNVGLCAGPVSDAECQLSAWWTQRARELLDELERHRETYRPLW